MLQPLTVKTDSVIRLKDHYGYKWWKKQEPDMAQVQLEVIDIWHFGMSALFDGPADTEAVAERILEQLANREAVSTGVHEATEELALHALESHSFCASRFRDLMTATGLNFDSLYLAYVGKNVLNFFRQDHGYQDGSYIKLWRGREDNEHLVQLAAELDSDATDFADQLYQSLKRRYDECRTG
jgi:hypothetical protein